MFLYVGTYTEPPMGRAQGISVFWFDEWTGEISPVQTLTGIVNASFLAVGKGGDRLYAVNEEDKGRVTAFAIDPDTGALTELNSQSSHGASPCFVSLDHTGRFVLVANYLSGTVAALPLTIHGHLEPASAVVQHTGSSIDPIRQQEPHAHMIAATPDGRLLATDLGTDSIVVYHLNLAGELIETGKVPVEPGSGPRHFVFSADGRVLYVICELASTIAAYAYDGLGNFHHKQTISTLPEGYTGYNDCAQIAVSATGRFLYGSNRGSDTIAIFAIDPLSDELRLIGHQSTLGKTPRNFNIDPSGRWLLAANQDSDTIAVFRRDLETGLLTPHGPLLETPSPVAILFV